jgi:choice-of-anchor C domain-containing protein
MANHVVRIREADLKGALSEVAGVPTVGAALIDSGTIGFSDVDIGDTHTLTVNGFNAGSSNVASALGTFVAVRTSDTTGGAGGLITWTYQVDAAAIEYLAKGEKRIEAFDVSIDDGHGSLVTRTIVVTISGSNDGPVVTTADLSGAVTEALGKPVTGTTLSDSGTIAFSDVDLSNTHSVRVSEIGDPLGRVTATVTSDTTGSGAGGLVTWSYEVTAAKVEHMAAGEQRIETFDIIVKDKNGGFATQTVSVTITGTNDGVVLANQDVTGRVAETTGTPTSGAQLSDTGSIKFTDADVSDVHAASVVGFNAGASNVASALGAITATITTDTVDGKGGVLTWTYTVNADAVEYLNAGQTRVEAFDIAVDDGHGGAAIKTVVVTINGSNDVSVNQPPVITSGVQAGAAAEIVDNAAGENTTTHGQSGSVAFTDANISDTHTASFATQSGGYLGTFAIDPLDQSADSVGWTFSVDDSALDHLKAGQTLIQSYDVTVNDGHGGTASQTVTITITGTNDGATISGSSTGAVEEDGTLAIGGTLAVSDADSGESQFQAPASLAGIYGTFAFDATTGVWNYTLDNSAAGVQSLASGAIVHDTLTVQSADGTAAQVIDVAIAGTNDGATISGSAIGAVTEDGSLTTGGTLAANDADSGESQFQPPASLAGTYGTFSFDATTGAWGYTLDNGATSVQALANGQLVHDTLTVSSTDGTASQVIDVAITGTNDGATISGSSIGAVAEDGTLTTGGTLSVSDPDGGESQFQTPASLAGSYGAFSFNASTGEWSYTLDNSEASVQALANGQVVHDTLTVHSVDGSTSQVIDVAIAGSNDAPTISAAVGGGDLLVNGSFDQIAGAPGNYAVVAGGSTDITGWTVTGVGIDWLDNTYWEASDGLASLDLSGTLFDGSFVYAGGIEQTFATTAGEQYTVTFDLAGNSYAQAIETVRVSAAGQSQDYSFDTAGHSNSDMGWIGQTFTFTATGTSTTLNFSSLDGSGDFAGATIDNVHVAAAGSSSIEGAVTEAADGSADETNDVTHQATGAIAFADIDLADTHTVSVTPADGGYRGTLSASIADDATGDGAGSIQWTFSASDSALDDLADGETLTQTYDVTVDDGQGVTATQTVTITIVGANDGASITGSSSGAVAEDGALAAGGTLAVNDPDGGESQFQTPASLAGIYGTFAFDATTGVWGYTLDNSAADVQALANGEVVHDTLTVHSIDGSTSQVIDVAITGSNDAPTVVGSSGNLLVNGSFEDSPGNGTYNSYFAASEPNTMPGWTITQDGVQLIGEPYWQASDGLNSVQMKVAGHNHFGVLEQSFATTPGTQYDVTFDMTANWADGATHSIQVSADGQAQGYSANGSGNNNANMGWSPRSFSFVADDSTATLRIASTDSFLYGAVVDNFAVSAAGGGGAAEGAVTEAADGSADETSNVTHQATGAIAFADIDLADTHTVSVTPADGGYRGTLSAGIADDTTGDGAGSIQWTFSASDSTLDDLAAGETLTQTYDVTVDDGQGGTATQTVTVTIAGSNDGAVIAGTATATLQEDVGVASGNLTASGDLTVADVDAGEASFQAQAGTAGSYGTFALDTAGHWTYTADNSQAAIQGLAVDEHLTDQFTAVSADGTAQTVTITINGTNDVTYVADGSVDPSATKLGAGTQLIVGSGIPTNHFGLAQQTDVGVELGLQVIYRQGPTVTTSDTYADNALHFTVNDGAQSTLNGSSSNNANRAAWSFDYSIATGLNGEAGNLNDYTFKLLYDVDPTAGASYRTLTLEPGGSGSSAHQWRDQDTGLVFIADDGGNANVTQNSENYAFSFFQSFLTSPYGAANNFDGPAQFDLVLEAHRSGQLLASNHVVVDVVETNDPPTANPDSNGADAVTETGLAAGDSSASGNVLTNDTDPDAGDSKTVTTTGAFTGTYGALTLNANGSWTYALDNGAAGTNALTQGQAVSDVFSYTMQDGEGLASSSTLAINITGANDGAIITGSSTGTVAEDGTLTAGGTLTMSDPDSGQSQFQTPASLAGTYGTFAFDATTGVWGYTLDNSAADVQALANGEVVHDTLTVHSIDGSTSQVIDVAITGSNDAPTISAAVGGGNLLVNGGFEDSPGNGFYNSYFAASEPNALPGWTITQDGVQLIGEPYWQASDGLNSVQMKVAGYNHFGVLEQSFATTPGTQYDVTFDMTANWADGATHSIQVSADGQAQGYSANGSGNNNANMGWSPRSFSFVADDSTATLRIASTDSFLYGAVVDNFAVSAPGGGGAAPEGAVAEAADGSADEANNVTHQATGAIAFADIDLADTHTVSVTPAHGGYRGTLSASIADDTTGDGAGSIQWTFSASDSALNDLAAGETLTQTYDVTVDDGQGGAATQTVTITINGADDGTIITGSSTGAVAEDGTLTAGGTLTANDPDSGASQFQAPSSLAGSYGTFSFNAGTGVWGYTLDNSAANVQALANGEVVHDTLTVHSIDGSASQVIDVTIIGSNDTPTITASTGDLLVNGGFEAPDVGGSYVNYFAAGDMGAIPGWQITQNGVQVVGTFWQASEGNQSLQMKNPGFNHFGAIEQSFATTPGTQYDVTFDMTANWADGATHSIQVSADGQSQAYFANGAGNNNSNMGWSPRAFSFVADDSNATLRIASTDTFLYGAVVDNFVASAGGGGSPTEGAVTEAADGSADETNNVLHQATGAIAFADIDLSDTHTVTVAPAGGGVGYRGTLTASIADDTTGDGAGSIQWTFSASDSELDNLAVSQILAQTYDVTVDDGHGGTATQTVTMTITGSHDTVVVNQAPVGLPDSYSVGEASNMVQTTLSVDAANGVLGGGFVGDHDPDGGPQSLTAELMSGPLHAALFEFNNDGSFVYRPDPYYLSYTSDSVVGGTFSTNYSGPAQPDSFVYRAFDGQDYSDPVTVNITVTPPPLVHVNPLGYDMQGSHDPLTAPMGQLYDDLALGGRTFARGIEVPGAGPPVSDTAGFTVATNDLVYVVSGSGFQYDVNDTPIAGLITGLTIRNPAYDPDAPAPNTPADLLSMVSEANGPVPAWNVPAADFVQALADYETSGDRSGLDAIFQSVRYSQVGAGPEGHEADGMVGGPFDDYFAGAGGHDTIVGGAGNDFIIPGAAGGTSTGGTGRDWFQFGASDSFNFVTDFSGVTGGELDLIDLRVVAVYDEQGLVYSASSFAEVLGQATQVDPTTVVLDFSFGQVDPTIITLQNTTVASLHQNDFLYSTLV